MSGGAPRAIYTTTSPTMYVRNLADLRPRVVTGGAYTPYVPPSDLNVPQALISRP